jgi:putative membrane protein
LEEKMKTAWTIIGIVIIVVLVLALISGAALMGIRGGFGGRGMMGGYGMMGGFGYHPVGGLVSFVFSLLVVAAIIWLVWWFARRSPVTGASNAVETPLEIIKLRYAKGEITKEQFDTMKKDLQE